MSLGSRFFSEHAYDEVSIDDIARAAGISKGLLYHYFPTKRDFYVATLRAAAAELLSRTRPDPSAPPLERLAAALDAYLAHVHDHGPAYAALLRGGIGSDIEVAAVVEQVRRTFLDRLLEGIGTREPGPLLSTLLRGWLGAVEAASLEWVAARGVPASALREALVDLLLATLRTAGNVPPEPPAWQPPW